MKRLFILLLFVSSLGFSQSSGITYQAVIYNPNGEELPGVDNPYAPLTNQDVCLQFGIVDADGNIEYQEEVQVTTDAFGMVNLLIGTNSQTGGYAADFAGIEWSADAKFLKVDLDIKGNCTDFEELSYQPFTYVPFAYYSPASDVPGPEGPVGPAGADGQDGNDGATGPSGPSGATGLVGPAGPNGQDGATGPAGPSGPEGPQGPAGADDVPNGFYLNTFDDSSPTYIIPGWQWSNTSFTQPDINRIYFFPISIVKNISLNKIGMRIQDSNLAPGAVATIAIYTENSGQPFQKIFDFGDLISTDPQGSEMSLKEINTDINIGNYFIGVKILVEFGTSVLSIYNGGLTAFITTPFSSALTFDENNGINEAPLGYYLIDSNLEDEYSIPISGLSYNKDTTPFIFFNVSPN